MTTAYNKKTMPLKIFREITHWSGFRRQPNHVYLMDGDRAYAYSKWGKDKPFYFRNFQRLDRRGRKFEEVNINPWGFDFNSRKEEPAEVPVGQVWQIAGSKGDQYTVTMTNSVWTCSCPGHGFRGRCRHVDQLRASNPQLV